MTGNRFTVIGATLCLVWTTCPRIACAQNPAVPVYASSRPVSGLIRVWGSPQMNDLLRMEEAAYHKEQPLVRFEVSLKSTLTAVAGVYTSRAEIGLLGREIWPSEAEAFHAITSRTPTVIEVATGSYDVPKATFALMIFVNRDNPLQSLSLEQLSRIFGTHASSAAPTWGDLGLPGAWAQRPIHLYGFARENDKAQIFRKLVFTDDEEWSCALQEFSDSKGANPLDAGEQIVRAVAADPEGIGISNVHYAVPDVREVAIASAGTATPVSPSRATVTDRSYPLTRAIYIVFDGGAQAASSPAVREFLRFVLSRQGQQAIEREGNYLPLPAKVAAEQRHRLSPSPN